MITVMERQEDKATCATFDAIQSYKKEFFDLYGELLTVATEAGCKHLIPDNSTVSVMEVRVLFELDGSDERAAWLALAETLLNIQRNAEMADGNCCEIYHRAAYLVHRALVIAQKMQEVM